MDDQVVNVKQIAQYPAASDAGANDFLVIQRGGVGGPYASIPASLFAPWTGSATNPNAGFVWINPFTGKELMGLNAEGVLSVFGDLVATGNLGDFGALNVGGYASIGGSLGVTGGGSFNGPVTVGNASGDGDAVNVDTLNMLLDQFSQGIVRSFNGRVGDVSLILQDIVIGGGAPIDSPQFLGCPAAPTPEVSSYSSRLATTKYVRDAFDEFWRCYFTTEVIEQVIFEPIKQWSLETFQQIPTVSSAQPTAPIDGSLWWNPVNGRLSIWVQPDPTVTGAWQVIGGGSQGPQGIPGPTGPSGPQGPQGLQGVTGSQGPQGVTGPAGPPGTTAFTNINPRGMWQPATTYFKNDYVIGTDNQGYVCITDTSVGDLPSNTSLTWRLFIAQGAPGPQGADGATGPQGAPGVTGPTGPPGPPGPDGQQGIQGPDGNPGAAGPAGPTGPTGPEGPQGPPGPTGPQGLTGPQGSQGPSGAGIIPGGTIGQVLAKLSNTDYDVSWQTKAPGLPTGGALGQVLTKQSVTDFDAVWANPQVAVQHSGRLLYVSTSALSYLPFNGNLLKINGLLYPIPATGIVGLNYANVFVNGVAGQQLATSTLYYVYVFNNNGVLTADYSTVGPVSSTTTGNVGTQVKGPTGTPDDSRSLIGIIYTISNGFNDGAGGRYVRSWFNRMPTRGLAAQASGVILAGGGAYVTISGQAGFVCWNDDGIMLSSVSFFQGVNAATTVYANIQVDGANYGLGTQQTSAVQGSWSNLTFTTYQFGFSNGLHTFQIQAAATPNQASAYGAGEMMLTANR